MNKVKDLYKNLSVSLLILEVVIVWSYFLDYRPEIGGRFLLINSVLGMIGVVFSIGIKSRLYKYLFVACHMIMIFFYPVLFLISAYFGF
ncbi:MULTISPECIES: hypothetical protein [Vagococcus]|uniref:hypothetical protein n=1 Tax=Vagococcus TaxID=2737 RepID=UPI000B35EA10|nr:MULTISPECIES: hypothetical protein [Vagococcus]HCM89480.1 hypothetical protein [Vagococcus sp.]